MDVIYVSFITNVISILILYSLHFLVLTNEIHFDEKWLDEQKISM